MRYHILIALLIPLLTSCAAPLALNLAHTDPPNPSSIGKNHGLVYFYRQQESVASGWGMHIFADGQLIGGLNSGTYFVYQAEPGETTFATKNGTANNITRVIDVKPGTRYYIQGFFHSTFTEYTPAICTMNTFEGEMAIKKLTYATLNEQK